MSTLILFAAVLAQSPPVTYPAGVYTVTTPASTTITYTATSVTFSWAAKPSPDPVPTPTPPTPPPDPSPSPIPVTTGHLWAVAIYDANVTLTDAQRLALTSKTLQASSLLLDIDFQVYPKTDPAVASWLHLMPSSGLPALLIIKKAGGGPGGTLIYAGGLPASESEILSLENKLRGK